MLLNLVFYVNKLTVKCQIQNRSLNITMPFKGRTRHASVLLQGCPHWVVHIRCNVVASIAVVVVAITGANVNESKAIMANNFSHLQRKTGSARSPEPLTPPVTPTAPHRPNGSDSWRVGKWGEVEVDVEGAEDWDWGRDKARVPADNERKPQKSCIINHLLIIDLTKREFHIHFSSSM